jgi:hypothetical protein
VDGQGECRILTKTPNRLDFDELAFPLNIHIPDGWGRVYTDVPIDLTLPEPDEPTVVIGQQHILDDALDKLAGN